jgi:hypothetical protein
MTMCRILELIRRLLAFASQQPPWLARHRQQQTDQQNTDQDELPEPWRFDEEKPLPDAWRWDE